MDLNVVIGALGLLLAALSEIRTIQHDKKHEVVRPIGVALLQVLLVLDKIIEVGDELISIFANAPPTAFIRTQDDSWREHQAETTRDRLNNLIRKQLQNLGNLAQLFEGPISSFNLNACVTLAKAIEVMIPGAREWKYKGKRKHNYLIALQWLTLHRGAPLTKLGRSLRNALSTLGKSTSVEDFLSSPGDGVRLISPTKVRVRVLEPNFAVSEADKTEVLDTVVYDLSKASDLRQLISEANEQLNEIRVMRNQLEEFVKANFTIDDLVK